jgi:F0F1-type ATP synthase assembly protein I
MSENEREIFLARSLRYMQENIRRAGPAVVAGYTLIAALLVLGGIGYGLDVWLQSSPWLLVTGLLMGIIVGFFQLAKIVWRK